MHSFIIAGHSSYIYTYCGAGPDGGTGQENSPATELLASRDGRDRDYMLLQKRGGLDFTDQHI